MGGTVRGMDAAPGAPRDGFTASRGRIREQCRHGGQRAGRRNMLTRFFFTLREAGIPVSLTEHLTLLEALEARVATLSADDFYWLARTALVKDEKHFDRFDRAFAAHFKGVENAFAALEAALPSARLVEVGILSGGERAGAAAATRRQPRVLIGGLGMGFTLAAALRRLPAEGRAVVAELVGATGGVGYELLRQQQLFDMAGAMAWTLQLVLFVLIVQQTINAIEAYALRYRAVSERAM